MCKIISSDAVIGNFILASVEKNSFDVSFEKIIDYDEKLSENLKAHHYFTRFDYEKILDFTENYPFFVEASEPGHIKIFPASNGKKNLVNQLMRYFRIGMPKLVIDEMKSVSDSIFAME